MVENGSASFYKDRKHENTNKEEFKFALSKYFYFFVRIILVTFFSDDVKLSREQHHKKSFVLKLAFGETEVLLEVENQVRSHSRVHHNRTLDRAHAIYIPPSALDLNLENLEQMGCLGYL